jgi:hypothetical protein|tara:strand:+ start:231 stop:470 length:240 start_codon:yes stop_codon:yes gene_type:complete
MRAQIPDLNKPVFKIFEQQRQDVLNGKCPTCRRDVGEFRDEISAKEYLISGMCQPCQDDVFGVNYSECEDPDAVFEQWE